MVVAPAFASGDLVLSKEFTIRDAVDGANFAPTHTVATPGHLSIGFESGTNLQTFTSRAFLATTSGAKTTAADVLVIRITAPAGFVIGTVSYEQVGTRTLSPFLPTGGLGSGTIQITGAALNVTYVR